MTFVWWLPFWVFAGGINTFPSERMCHEHISKLKQGKVVWEGD